MVLGLWVFPAKEKRLASIITQETGSMKPASLLLDRITQPTYQRLKGGHGMAAVRITRIRAAVVTPACLLASGFTLRPETNSRI